MILRLFAILTAMAWTSAAYAQLPNLDIKSGNLSAGSTTATGGATARTLADRFADIANVLNFGADPTGVADSTTAFNAAAAATRFSSLRCVYVPAGTYHLTNALALGSTSTPGCIYGDGVGSIIDVNSDFNSSASGVIVVTGNLTGTGPRIEHLHFVFHQPTTQAVRANFATLAAGCTTTTNGTGCKYPWAIYMHQVDRPIVRGIRIDAAWDGVNYTGVNGQDYGGAWIQNNEIGALDIGIYIENNFDIAHVNGNHFWPFQFAGTSLATGVYNDGNTYAMQIGRSDGIDVSDVLAIGTRISLLSTFTLGHFRGIKLDTGADMEIAGSTGPGVQIDQIYQDGTTTSGLCAINVSGGSSVNMQDVTVIPGTSSAFCMSGNNGGTVSIIGGSISTTSTSVAPIVSTNTGLAKLRLRNLNLNAPTATTAPVINVTGNDVLEAVGNTIFTAGIGGNAITVPDSAGNIITANNWNGWVFTPPGPLGYYTPAYKSYWNAAGTFTYTLPLGYSGVEIRGCGWGGPAGGGAVQANNAASSGGGGGGAGLCLDQKYIASAVSSGLSIVVGTAATGGAATTAAIASPTAGHNGTQGGNTTVSTGSTRLMTLYPGGAGAGGQLAANSGGGGSAGSCGAGGNGSGATAGAAGACGGVIGGAGTQSGSNAGAGVSGGAGAGSGGAAGAPGNGGIASDIYQAAGGGAGGGTTSAAGANNGGFGGRAIGDAFAGQATNGTSSAPNGVSPTAIANDLPTSGATAGWGGSTGTAVAGNGGNGVQGDGGGGGGSCTAASGSCTAGKGGDGGKSFVELIPLP